MVFLGCVENNSYLCKQSCTDQSNRPNSVPVSPCDPKSLRGLGAFAVSGIELKEYSVFDSQRLSDYSEDEINKIWDDLFRDVEQDVADFLKENPVAESFLPYDEQKYGKVDPIYTLMMDIYSGNADKALERINSYKSCGKGSGYSGPKGDAFDYIAEWCKKKVKSNTFEHLLKWCKNKLQ